MKVFFTVLLIIVVLHFGQFAYADVRTLDLRDCNAGQSRDIRMANQFLREFQKVLINDFEFDARLPRSEERVKRKIDRLIDDMRITCGRRNICDSVSGKSFALAGRFILCMRNINNFCTLVDTMAHEFAHWIGITSDIGHNQGSFDSVFKFENFSRDLCNLYSRPDGATVALPVPEDIEVRAIACSKVLPLGGVLIYSRKGYQGCPRTITLPYPDLRTLGRNRSISSIRINDNRIWEGCKGRNYNSWCMRINEDLSDLSGSGFNNKIDSIRPIPAITSGVVVYRNQNFRGGHRIITRATGNLNGTGINNEISSIELFGARSWQVCRDQEYGRCEVVTGNVSDLRNLDTNMNNRITSLRPL